MAKKKAKKPAVSKKAPAGKKAAPKGKPAAKKPAAEKRGPALRADKTGAALHSLLGDLRGGPMKEEE